ncbi:MAG: hypothetical protein ACPG8K_02880, partial [Crocinitomicaceae bacterium]
MNRICIILLLLVSTIAVGQTSEKYNSEYAEFYKAEDLYEKEQYGSAKKEFREFIDELGGETGKIYTHLTYNRQIKVPGVGNATAVRT